jgi:FkbM family methyltransferase
MNNNENDFIFEKYIKDEKINNIFELGSRDLIDAVKLYNKYNSKIYSFECSPDCLKECYKTFSEMDDDSKKNIELIEKAVCIENNMVDFYMFDINKLNNIGASSMLINNFSNRYYDDPDLNKEMCQIKIKVHGIRLDSFCDERKINNIDLIWMDLQGYELMALKSLGVYLKNVKYIYTECSLNPTYINGVDFIELTEFLFENGFEYITSDEFKEDLPTINELKNIKNFGICIEFNSFFKNKNL